jgi:integrase
LTQKAVDRLRAPTASGKQEIHWDAELRGFGILLSGVSNSRTYIAQRDLPGGKTRRVTIASTAEMALAKAKEAAREILVDMRRGIDPKRKATGTLQETLDAYLKANKDIRPRTREVYASFVRLYLAPWQDRPLASITPADVDAMHQDIADKIAKRGRHSGHTVANDALCIFRLLYNWAANRNDDLPRNPVRIRGSEWHKVTPKRNPIDPAKLNIWCAAVMELPPLGRDYLTVALFTGMRRREVAALRWSEIDFGQRLIRLPAHRAKSGRPIDLPMSDVVHSILVARRALGDGVFVFPAAYGRNGYIQTARAWTDAVTAKTGIEFTLHDLRRTFASTAEACDLPWTVLKALLNHSLPKGTTESYIKMTPLREPVQKVADELKRLCGISAPSGNVVAL